MSSTHVYCKTLHDSTHSREVTHRHSYTPTWVRSSTEESLIKLFSKNGWMPELQRRYIISWPLPWITLYTHTHTLIYVQVLKNALTHILTHAHKPFPALPLRWNCRSVPFLHGALPAPLSTLPVCDPCVCWKRKHLTSCPFLLVRSHRISSYAEYGPSTVLTPSAPVWKIHMRPELDIWCVSFECVFLFPSVTSDGFAFYQREHQSTSLTFNRKPGQVEKHTCMHGAPRTYTK